MVAATSTPSDHDSPNATATARSVYVFAHTAARQMGLEPRFCGGALAYFGAQQAALAGTLDIALERLSEMRILPQDGIQ